MKDEESEPETTSAPPKQPGHDTAAMTSGDQTSSHCLPASTFHCVTCADEALEAQVLAIDALNAVALVVADGVTGEVDISLIDDLAPSDRLLIHGGVALAKV